MKMKKVSAIILTLLLSFSFVGCTTAQNESETTTDIQTSDTSAVSNEITTEVSSTAETDSQVSTSIEGSALNTTEMFTERDLQQSADLTGATEITVSDGQDVAIDTEGVYVLSGEAKNVSIIVEADEEAKVQIVLDGISITNESAPVIYVKSADKVFVTSTDSENYMEVSGTFVADGDTNTDAVVFSKSDLVFNGTGTLEIVSAQGNGITSKDQLKVTGGIYNITSAADGLEANDAILVYDGDISADSDKDALHSENEDDATMGNIYILNGTFNITADDDAIQGNNIVQIDGGTINVETCAEGIEGTYIQINGGQIDIYATDDGINATNKSTSDVVLEVNGGTINVTMGSGDTDAFDSNGDLYINGGTISIEANSAFDAAGIAELNGGTVTVNGETVTQITQSQMGGGKHRN